MIYRQPEIFTDSQAVNLDAYIHRLQVALNGIEWLEHTFGRAYKAYTLQSNKKYIYPEVYAGGPDMQNMFALDEFKSYCFFSARDKAEPASGRNEYEVGTWNEWVQPVDIIVWFNSIKTSPDRAFLRTEPYLQDVRKALRLISFYNITGVFYDAANVFSEYSLDIYESQYLRHPFGGFKIEGKIQFLEQDNNQSC